jgi:uncharacterized alpha/beta hydrolase family protein
MFRPLRAIFKWNIYIYIYILVIIIIIIIIIIIKVKVNKKHSKNTVAIDGVPKEFNNRRKKMQPSKI